MLFVLGLVVSCGDGKLPEERKVTPTNQPFEMDNSDTVVSGNARAGDLVATIDIVGDLPSWAGACDSTFTVAGTPYTGECPGCTWNFQVRATEVRDDTDLCPSAEDGPAMLSVMTWRVWNWQYNVLLGYSPYFSGSTLYGAPVSGPTLQWGVEYYPDPLFFAAAYEKGTYGVLGEATDTTMEWSMDWVYYYYGQKNTLHSTGSAYIVQ